MHIERNDPKAKRLIGTIDLACKLNCHPNSIPRFIKNRKGFPKPKCLFGKNVWDEAVVDAYIEKLMAGA
jgi:predicted DNA-binding transcriptional regulator AlpA